MSILSDKTLLRDFDKLIIGGDKNRVASCSYSFAVGKLFPTGQGPDGQARKVIDWTRERSPDATHAIKPGELLVLRTLETVSMPGSWCGFWYQMDPLSKKGLLLVNMSIVGPGYKGHLTCTFANFGKDDVVLTPHQPIAKLVFMELDQPASRQSHEWPSERYDSDQAILAYESAPTFLQIAEHASEIAVLVATGKATIARASDEEVARATASVKQAAIDEASAAKVSVKEDTWKTLVKASPVAAIAIALLAAVQCVAEKYITPSVESVSKARADEIETEINRQLSTLPNKPTFVYAGSAESKAMLDRLDAMERDLKAMHDVPAPRPSASSQPPKK